MLRHGMDMSATQARTALKQLQVVKPHSKSGYDRESFPHWRDADTWGWTKAPDESCDAREAALYRDGSNVKVTDDCTVTSGAWVDPYTGKKVTDPSGLDIDHMVPLANAYQSGAWKWSEEKRTKYANNPLVVVTSGLSSNRSKGDKGPESWKPPLKSAWCAYAIRWVDVKSTWGLTLKNDQERVALEKMLGTCRK